MSKNKSQKQTNLINAYHAAIAVFEKHMKKIIHTSYANREAIDLFHGELMNDKRIKPLFNFKKDAQRLGMSRKLIKKHTYYLVRNTIGKNLEALPMEMIDFVVDNHTSQVFDRLRYVVPSDDIALFLKNKIFNEKKEELIRDIDFSNMDEFLLFASMDRASIKTNAKRIARKLVERFNEIPKQNQLKEVIDFKTIIVNYTHMDEGECPNMTYAYYCVTEELNKINPSLRQKLRIGHTGEKKYTNGTKELETFVDEYVKVVMVEEIL